MNLVKQYKKYSIFVYVIVLLYFSILVGDAEVIKPIPSKLKLYPFSYSQDFENRDPFYIWASNGTYKINYKGLSSEKSSSGKKSFKIDITFGTAGYVYFQIPVKVPTEGELKFKGDIYVEQANGASAALGTKISFFPCPRSGVNILSKQKKHSQVWKTQTSDLVEAGVAKAKAHTHKYLTDVKYTDLGIWTNNIGLFLFGKKKGSRITVYIDNIILEGNVPKVRDYKALKGKRWSAYKIEMGKKIKNLVEQIGTFKKSRVNAILKSVKKRGYILISEYKSLVEIKTDRKFDTASINYTDDDFFIYPWNPTSPRKILPNTFPIPAYQSKSLGIIACPGEREPVSFIIRAKKALSNVKINSSEFVNTKGNIILPTAVDIRLVKCWYQSGIDGLKKSKNRYLVPELLLKDDRLIEIDEKAKTNSLRVYLEGEKRYIPISDSNSTLPQNALIIDSKTIQAFDLKRETNKQVWLTVKIPENALPGEYRGQIQIKANDKPPVKLELKITVLNFKLPDPCLEYSIYYTGKLVDDDIQIIGSNKKNREQYKLEMKNLRTHGISSATIYQKLDNMLGEALKIRSNAGIAGKNLYVLGTWTGSPKDDEDIEILTNKVSKWIEYGNKFNYTEIYIYGVDEANLKVIRSQKKAWQAVHKLGAKIFVACPYNAIEVAEGLLDIGVIGKKLDSLIASNWHAHGSKVFSYGNPQVGVEDPNIYRKNYGFALWLAGYDGTMNFAYQYEMGNIWNDFDSRKIYRDHVFAYPVTNGVIDTVQWEGFCEAVDDIRYLSKLLLLKKMDEASVKEWLNKMIQDDYSLSQIRKEIIEKCKQAVRYNKK